MKKYLSILAVTALAASAFAQGTVNFANSAASLVKVGASATDPAAVAMASPGFVQLYWAPAGTALVAYTGDAAAWKAANPLWAFAGDPKGLIASPGRFVGGTVTIPGIAAGGPIEAAVVAWKGNYASFDAAVAAKTEIGVSSRVTFAATGNPNAVPAGTPASLTAAGFTGVTAFAGAVVPEPSSLALAGLGAAALLIFRRRK